MPRNLGTDATAATYCTSEQANSSVRHEPTPPRAAAAPARRRGVRTQSAHARACLREKPRHQERHRLRGHIRLFEASRGIGRAS